MGIPFTTSVVYPFVWLTVVWTSEALSIAIIASLENEIEKIFKMKRKEIVSKNDLLWQRNSGKRRSRQSKERLRFHPIH
jgi:hypothetical protein